MNHDNFHQNFKYNNGKSKKEQNCENCFQINKKTYIQSQPKKLLNNISFNIFMLYNMIYVRYSEAYIYHQHCNAIHI